MTLSYVLHIIRGSSSPQYKANQRFTSKVIHFSVASQPCALGWVPVWGESGRNGRWQRMGNPVFTCSSVFLWEHNVSDHISYLILVYSSLFTEISEPNDIITRHHIIKLLLAVVQSDLFNSRSSFPSEVPHKLVLKHRHRCTSGGHVQWCSSSSRLLYLFSARSWVIKRNPLHLNNYHSFPCISKCFYLISTESNFPKLQLPAGSPPPFSFSLSLSPSWPPYFLLLLNT